MKRIFLTTIILTFVQILQAQKLDKTTIDKNFKLKNDAVYIVNGLAYKQNDSLKFNSVLKSYQIKYLVEINKLSEEGGIVRCATNDVVFIQFATQQPNSIIKKKLKEIKEKFPDIYSSFSQHILTDSKNPVLIVNNKTIHHTESGNIIEKLNASEVFFIDYKSQPQAKEYYGENAKNGIVKIWTK